MYFIHTAENIVKLLSPPGSHHSSFLIPGADIQLQGEPLQWGAKYTGWEKFAIFDRYRLLPRKRQEIGRLLLLNAYRKSYALYRMMTFSMTFTDSYPRLQARIDSQLAVSGTAKVAKLNGAQLTSDNRAVYETH